MTLHGNRPITPDPLRGIPNNHSKTSNPIPGAIEAARQPDPRGPKVDETSISISGHRETTPRYKGKNKGNPQRAPIRTGPAQSADDRRLHLEGQKARLQYNRVT